MYQVHTHSFDMVAIKMLNICGFSFLEAHQGDKCAHLGMLSRTNTHLPPMEIG